jgi:peptidoglycan hydrolase CwlO-like protein
LRRSWALTSAAISCGPRATVVASAHLDAIDHKLRDASDKKLTNVHQHAEAIHEHVQALADPIASFPQAGDDYAKLKTQSEKFLEATRSGKHEDAHEHHQRLTEILRRLRAAVAGGG